MARVRPVRATPVSSIPPSRLVGGGVQNPVATRVPLVAFSSRPLLVVFGGVVVMAGVLGWALEAEYGGSGPQSFIVIVALIPGRKTRMTTD